jgi:hypothetical protein
MPWRLTTANAQQERTMRIALVFQNSFCFANYESAFIFRIIRWWLAHRGENMHIKIEHALRSWERLCQEPKKEMIFRRDSELSHWLERAACPIVRELSAGPDFRQWARWSIDNLREGSETEPRRLIDAIDSNLVSSAKAMAKVLRRPNVQRALAQEDSHAAKPAKGSGKRTGTNRATEEVSSGNLGAGVAEKQLGEAICPPGGSRSAHEEMLSTLNFIGARPWRDLVSELDFFGPSVELNLIDRKKWFGPATRQVQVGDFLSFLNPRFGTLGDFVVACLEVRVDYWNRIMSRMFVVVQSALRESHSDNTADEQLLHDATMPVEPLLRQLRILVYDVPESNRRMASMILVQIHAAYFPSADHSWLGDAGPLAANAVIFRWRVEGTNAGAQPLGVSIPDTVAVALTEIAKFFRQDVDTDLYIQEMARTHRFCLVDGRGRREAYCNSKLLDIDWQKHARAWTLLIALAEMAKISHQGVDEACELGISLRDARRDLLNLLGQSDLAKFVTIKKAVHRLTLHDSELCFLRFTSVDRLEEVVRDKQGP